MVRTPLRELGKWISIVHRKSQIHMNQAGRELGLNLTECHYIMHLKENTPTHRKWLTEHLSLDDAMTTRTLRNLEERGLIIQERSEEDQRALSVRLTPEGARLIPQIHRIQKNWMENLTRDFTAEEIRTLEQTLSVVASRAIEATEKDRESRSC
ncbi:MAG: MarR family winged helix-turn-helix transcriptional regulator [Peptoniphilaceae bacterium]|jgi:DNA-binding MarR family transcriptional regulator